MSAVRRTAAVVTAGVGALAVVGLASGPALADAPTKTGWWNAASANGVALPQPTTKDDDLHVAQGPAGPAAFAAVAYDFAGVTVTGGTLVLKIASGTAVGTVAVQACPTKDTAWKAGGNQPMDTAPAYDCTNGVTGIASGDGTVVTFVLRAGQVLPTGGFSFALVPAKDAVPFSVDFAKPDATSLTPETDAGDDSEAPVGEAAPYTPPDAGSSGTAPLSGGTVPAPPLDAVQPIAPAEVAPAPEPVAAAAPAPVAAPFVPVAAKPAPLSQRDRYAAGTMLALLAGALVWAFQQPGAQPRLIGGMARKADPAVVAQAALVDTRPRGIGRFATLRTAPARRLV